MNSTPLQETHVLQFDREYPEGPVGVAINSGLIAEKQKLVDALQAVVKASGGDLALYVNGESFATTCSHILSALQRQARSSDVEVFVPQPGKV